MKQLLAFLDRIHVRNTKKEYYHFNFFASLHGAQMPSLEEVLGVASEEKAFDAKAESEMDALAQKMLEERKAMRRV